MTPVVWVETLEAVVVDRRSAWVWLVDTKGEAAASALRHVRASRTDLEDAARWRNAERGAARLIRRRLLRSLAARVLGCSPSVVEIVRDASGRCRVRAPQALFGSVARHGAWAALAVAPVPIGVDLEDAYPPAPLPLDVLPRALRAWVEAGADVAARFAQVWTALEGCAKAQGVGIAAVLEAKTRAGVHVHDGRLCIVDAELTSRVLASRCAGVVTHHAVAGTIGDQVRRRVGS